MQTSATAPMPGGVTTSQSPPFTLPMRYMLLGVIGFGLFALDLVAQSLHLGQAGALLPSVVALTHLLTLGSLLAFVMGAVYQLSTVAFLIPIGSSEIARMNFWLYAVSVAGLIGSMASWWTLGLVTFGTLATLSLYVYAGIVILSIARTRVKGAMQWFVLSAHVHLILAITVAWVIILSDFIPDMSAVLTPLILTHILLAVGGFFSFLVLGFTFKLLPMFTLSHGYATHRQKWTLLLAHVSLWVMIAGVWSNARGLLWVGAAFGAAAFAVQFSDIREILKKRLRKKLEPSIRTAVLGTAAGLFGTVTLIVQLLLRGGFPGWQSVVTFYLLGWITLTVMSYAYKIVPFLIWTKRYSRSAGRGKIPLIADLINPERARPVLCTFAAGVVALTIGTAAQWAVPAVAGSVLIGIAILAFCVQMVTVIDLKRIGKELRGDD